MQNLGMICGTCVVKSYLKVAIEKIKREHKQLKIVQGANSKWQDNNLEKQNLKERERLKRVDGVDI